MKEKQQHHRLSFCILFMIFVVVMFSMPCLVLAKSESAGAVDAQFIVDYMPGMEKIAQPLGGHYLAVIRNTGGDPLQVKDVSLNGVSVIKGLKHQGEREFTSIWFGEDESKPSEPIKKLIKAGEPVWYKIVPETIGVGELGFVLIKARNVPSKPVVVSIADSRGDVHVTPVSVKRSKIRLGYAGFGQNCDQMVLFIQKLTNEALTLDKVFLDKVDETDKCKIVSSKFWKDVGVVTLQLTEPLEEGSYHLLRITTKQGVQAVDMVRARKDFFPVGIYGWSSKGAIAIERMYDFYRSMNANYFNTDLTFLWAKDKTLRNSAKGRQLAEANGIMLINADGKHWYLQDEIDLQEGVHAKMLPESKRLGSMAQTDVIKVMQGRQKENPAAVGWLQMDGWGLPTHYFIHSRAADIPSGGDYAGQGGKQPIEVYNALSALRWAAMPGAFSTLIYASWEKGFGATRHPTPGEEKIMSSYCLAAGGKGLSYYSYDDSRPGGTGDHGVEGNPELLSAIGKINHAIQTLSPLLLKAFPVEVLVSGGGEKLWSRTLLCADGTVIVILVNEDFVSDKKGFTANPLKDVSVAVELPAWGEYDGAVRVDGLGVHKVNMSAGKDRGAVKVNLVEIETAELVVLGSSDMVKGLDRRFMELDNTSKQRVSQLATELEGIREQLDERRAELRLQGVLIKSGVDLDEGVDLADWRLNRENGAWPRYIAVSTEEKHSGRFSLEIMPDRHYSLPAAAAGGDEYRLEFYVKFSKASDDEHVLAGVEYLGYDGLPLGADELIVKASSGMWRRVEFKSKAPAGAATVQVRFEKKETVISAWVDDVVLMQISD